MNTLYLIGGSPRSGKTIIFNEVIKQRPMLAISSDGIRDGMRCAVIGETSVSIKKLSFSGDTIFHRSGEDRSMQHEKHFDQSTTEDEMTWKAILGMIGYYDRRNMSIIIEGMVITPEKIKELKLANLKLKAVFVGMTEESEIDSLIEYGYANKDWVHIKITQEDGNDESAVRDWFKAEIGKNKKIAGEARVGGYAFFSMGNRSFKDYKNEVVNYLLT